MNYPSIKEYKEAILFAEDNFEQLKNLRPVLGDDGEPVFSSGNFAVVFKMKDEQTGKKHALKCFLREQEGRAEAYRMIAEELEFVSSTFLTPIKYLDKELFVDTNASEDTEFPVLLMDWVEGETLDKYIRNHLDDQYELSLLAYQFSRLAMWLMPQPFAHGDLKPDNILVKDDGTLVLVDYDGMYVPAMKGQRARELGSPDFRHPSRTETDFDEHIDDFSLASILLSLKAISLQPSLLEEYGASDRLLFSEKDYRNLSESKVMDVLKPLMQDAELASLYSLFILAISQNNLSQVSFRLFNLSRPERSENENANLSMVVTDEELANAWIDEFGVKYSADRKRLLKAPTNIERYQIRKGTIVICNEAFTTDISRNDVWEPTFWGYGNYHQIKEYSSGCLKTVCIPNSVRVIGCSAFRGCICLESVVIPYGVETIEYGVFEHCHSLSSVHIPSSVKYIERNAFRGCINLRSIYLPNSIEKIGISSFYGLYLESIIIPQNSIERFKKLLPRCKDILIERSNEEMCIASCSEHSEACEGEDALWAAHAKIIKKNGKLGVVVDDGNTKKQIIPFNYDTWFDYDGYEIEIKEDFFDDSFCNIGYFAIKNTDGTFTIHGYDKDGNITESFICEKFDPDSYLLKGKYYLRHSTDGEGYDDIRRMRMDCETYSDTCYLAFCKGNKWTLKSDDLKKTYIDYIECDGFGQMAWTPKGYYVEIKKEEKVQLCLCKTKSGPLILPDLYDYISLRYYSTNAYKIQSSCFVLRQGELYAICSNGLHNISPFIFSKVGSMINDNEIKVMRNVNGKEYEFIYKIINSNGWRYKGARPFSADEVAAVERTEVVTSQYGNSLCIFMQSGGQTYIPLSKYSTLTVGDSIDLKTAKLITLSRDGDDDIYRVIE